MLQIPVLIAGGGPVGLNLSLELAHQGIQSIVAERNLTTTRHPKMDLTNGRSMELYRRIGMVETLRKIGIPEENPSVVSWITSLSGHELCRFSYPSAAEARQIRREHNDGTLTLEPQMRVSQTVIEPALKAAVDASDLGQTWFGWNVESFKQDADGVTTQLVNGQSGETRHVRSRYLVGCDGGNSTVRRQLGIQLQGKSNEAQAYMIHFKSTNLDLLQRFGIGWHYQTGTGTMIAQNDIDTWTLQYFLPPGADATTLNPDTVLKEWMGCDFDYEIILANPWWAHFVVADNYRKGNVFIAGDACHQWMPTGGYGMNCGVADAANLGWKLAATLNGWGGEALLESYEAERRPVALISRETAHRHLGVRIQISQLYAEAGDISGNTPEHAQRRADLGKKIELLGNAENEGWGAEHGYRYESGVVAKESGAAPVFDPLSYTPTTWPGSRLPHVFLADGSPIYDKLGLWHTLVVFSQTDTTPLEKAAAKAGAPLTVLRLSDENARNVYGCDLILVRPDHHVTWRGTKLPADCSSLVSLFTGAI